MTAPRCEYRIKTRQVVRARPAAATSAPRRRGWCSAMTLQGGLSGIPSARFVSPTVCHLLQVEPIQKLMLAPRYKVGSCAGRLK